jgi:hypothetical protein
MKLGGFVAVLLAGFAGQGATVCSGGPSLAWRKVFQVDKATLASTGRNAYFVLEPGYRLEFTHGRSTLVVTVLEETNEVDGVQSRVVEEREATAGSLTEVSRNYLAIDPTSGDLYYFGEEVDSYRNGKVVGHEYSWLAGVGGASFGLFLPGRPVVGDRFYQEVAPRVAMDRLEVISTDATVSTPAGRFERCLEVRETTPLEGESSRIWYAPGVGLVRDGDLVLVGIANAQGR